MGVYLQSFQFFNVMKCAFMSLCHLSMLVLAVRKVHVIMAEVVCLSCVFQPFRYVGNEVSSGTDVFKLEKLKS